MDATSVHAVEEETDVSPVFRQAAASPKPCEGALDDPSPRQDFEAFGGIRSFDDLDGPVAMAGGRVAQFLPGIATIGEDMA